MLTHLGSSLVPTPQHTCITPREGVHRTPSSESGLSHQLAQESSLWNSDLYCWILTDSVGPLHIYLPTKDRKYLGSKDFWELTLHGPLCNGGNAHLGDLCQSYH